MLVCGPQRFHISVARFTGIDEVFAAPGKTGPAKRNKQQVCSQAGTTAIAVRKHLNPDQAVMETHRNLVRPVAVMRYPVADIVEQLAEFYRDPMNVDTDLEKAVLASFVCFI